MFKTVLTFSFLLLSFFLFAFQAQANNDWKEYFSRNEMKAFKSAVKKSIIHDFKGRDKDWRGIIPSSFLENDVVVTENGKIPNSLLNTTSVSKKLYTGTFYDDPDDADVVVYVEDGNDSVYRHYQKIDIDEIDLDDMAIIEMYSKEDDSEFTDEFEGDIWKLRETRLNYYQDGKMYIYYSYSFPEDMGIDPGYYQCTAGETYKIVVVY